MDQVASLGTETQQVLCNVLRGWSVKSFCAGLEFSFLQLRLGTKPDS